MPTHQMKCALLSESVLRDGVDLEVLADPLHRFLNGGARTVIVVDGSGRLAPLEARLGRDGLERLFVGTPDAIRPRLSALGVSRDSLISIGADHRDLELRDYAQLHFHVGPRTCLDTKIRGVVPLIDQYEAGAANTLLHFCRRAQKDAALQSSDLVDFVGRAGKHLRLPENGAALLSKHATACRFLAERFPNEIAGLFGSGFPFYVFDGNFQRPAIAAPASVVTYCDEQHAYFSRKCVSEGSFLRNASGLFTPTRLAESLGLQAECNEFDAYEYQRVGQSCPSVPDGPQTLTQYYEANCFDIGSDLWPCQYCTPIQLQELYPAQQRIMDTNIDCLPCNQTSIKLRNVMGAAPDIDMLVMVRGNARDVASSIKRAVIDDATYHLYDLEIRRTVLEHDGPIDIFVFDLEEVFAALDRLASADWRGTSAETIALWCPTARFQARLDLCFALAFEPVIVTDDDLRLRVADTRRKFGGGVDVESIVTALREDSFWTQQLMGNQELVDALRARIVSWRTTMGDEDTIACITE